MNLDHGTGTTEFFAVGRPALLKIHGVGAAPHGTFHIVGTKVTGAATADLNTIDTGISLRNKHMKEKYLETDKFPETRFALTELTLPKSLLSSQTGREEVPFSGRLLLHGVEKPVSGVAVVSRSGEQIGIEADFPVKIADFGVTTPSYMGVTVTNEVTAHITSRAPLEIAK